MYVAIVANRGSRPAILLRESYRDGAKVRNRTLANLSKWPASKIEALRAVLRGAPLVPAGGEGLEIVRALPHGHVLAALGTARRIGLERLLPRAAARRARLALALIVARLLEPASKLGTARALDATTAPHSLGATLGLGRVTAKEVYATLDWLGAAQEAIEAQLARRHRSAGTLLLYDITSTYLEGRCCTLARHGYSRDGRRDKLQIIVGLMCTAEGCPIAVEVFEGDTSDPATLAGQIEKLKRRLGPRRIVLVGDRGMITSARIAEDLMPAGLDWITALRAPAIQRLAAEDGPLQRSLFDERDLAEITSPDYPGERLIVCRNPALGAERGAQAHRAARRHRARAEPHPGPRPARPSAAPGRRQDRPGGRHRARPAQGRQALPDHHHRRRARLCAGSGADRCRGCARWRGACPRAGTAGPGGAAHQCAGRKPERRRHGVRLQEPGPHRAGLPQPQDGRPRAAPGVPLDGAARARPRPLVHARLRPRMAPAPGARPDAVRRARPGRQRRPACLAGGQGAPSPAAKRKAKTKRTDDGLAVHSFRSLLATPTPRQQRTLDLLGVKPAL